MEQRPDDIILEEKIRAAYEHWYESLEKDSSNGLPNWGPLCTGLIMLERLIKDYDLDIEHHKTSNGSQIRGQGLSLAHKIFAKFGISMKLNSGEFGRTNRSSVPTAEKLLNALKPLHLESLPVDERNRMLSQVQKRLLDALLMYSDHFQVNTQYNPAMSTEKFVKSVLAQGNAKTSGAIAQHLVGAKLELRFPHIKISNYSASTADAPTERSGDFIIGDTIFHVTMNPGDLIFPKCLNNLRAGYRVYLLVPEEHIRLTIRKAKLYGLADDIVVKSIESFIGQNIDELGQFSTELLQQELMKLIEIYNRRIQIERYAPEISIENGISVELEPGEGR